MYMQPPYRFEIILEAAYRFYRTKHEEDSIKRRGLDTEKMSKKRRYERLSRV